MRIALQHALSSGVVLAIIETLSSAPGHAQCMSWDTSFSAQPPGFNIPVFDFVTFDNGSGPSLYAAADSNLFRWDGLSWTFVLGANDSIGALAVYDDGTGPQLYMGGDFTTCGNVPATGIARWNGGSIVTDVGGGVHGQGSVQQVRRLLVHNDGTGSKLYVCGYFVAAGTSNQLIQSRDIASWDGTTWIGYGGGVDSNTVHSMAFYDDGGGEKLFVGGGFTHAGGVLVNGIAKWTGTRWSSVGNLDTSFVVGMTSYDDGGGRALYASTIKPAGQATLQIARWNGSLWSAVGPGIYAGLEYAFAVFDDGSGPALYAGGNFWQAGGQLVNSIARWDGTTWSTLGSGLDGEVQALAVHDDGSGPSLFAGGWFTRAGDVPSIFVARWRACLGPVDSFCSGDGTLAPCPCGNTGAANHGCENSASTGGAHLQATGTTNPDTLVLTSTDELPSALSIVLQGDVLLSGSAPFGDGLRCAGGHLRRLFVKSAVSGTVTAPEAGEPSITQRSAEKGDPISPGFVRTYQVYYRDPSPSFCAAPTGSTFNASNGIRVVW